MIVRISLCNVAPGIALLLLGACSKQDARPALTESATFVDSIVNTETKAIREAHGNVSREGPQLRIHLTNGRDIVFTDDTIPGLRFSLPRYAGYLRPIHSHLIHTIQYEGPGVYSIVDDSTGDSTLIFGKPVISPDGRQFVVTAISEDEGGFPGLIEIWRMTGRKPEKEFSHNTEDEVWEASDPIWKDSVTIDFTENSHSNPGDPFDQKPARLRRIGNTWLITELRN